jgi:hypothetical protein
VREVDHVDEADGDVVTLGSAAAGGSAWPGVLADLLAQVDGEHESQSA